MACNSMSEAPILEMRGVSKRYDAGSYALKDVDLSIAPGEFVSVIGSSGAGKSTLLRCINRLIETTSGEVIFGGEDMRKLRGRKLRQARRRIAMIFQHYNLVYRATSIENVLQGRLGYKSALAGSLGLYSEEEKTQAFIALAQVGMAEFAYKRTDQLSGGQKQRVGIARALVQEPLLILADEPIASLDPRSARTVMDLLRWASDELGVACVVNLHQVDFALEYSDRVIALQQGKIVFDGAPADLDDASIAEIYGEDIARADEAKAMAMNDAGAALLREAEAVVARDLEPVSSHPNSTVDRAKEVAV